MPPDPDTAPQVLHASSVQLHGAALLILGASGSGKSTLALLLMAWGAGLIADDRTLVTRRDDGLWASCPQTIHGRIEARGIGILGADPAAPARIAAAIDLDRTETERLPPDRRLTLIGVDVPLILKSEGLSFAAGLVQYLKGRRQA